MVLTTTHVPAMRPLWFNMLQQVFNGTDPQAAADEFNASANSN